MMSGSNGAKLLAAGCCAKSHRERQGILSFKSGEAGSIDWPEDASTLGLANWPFWTGFHRSQQALRGSVQTDMASSSRESKAAACEDRSFVVEGGDASGRRA
jgi:hypothetical protein